MSHDYILVARGVRNGAFDAEPGSVSFVKVPANQIDYGPQNAIDSDRWVREVQGLADGDLNPNSISPTGDVLMFVHGYNNSIPNVLRRVRQLQADLRAQGWRGTVIAFDWPSDNQTLNYLEDRKDAAKVARKLVEQCIVLLNAGQMAGCETNIHLLGHSTGAYVIMEAFAQAEQDGTLFRGEWRIGQVAFIGGDVASDSLCATSDWCKPMFRRIMRLTNYSNPFDAVLGVSNAKRLGTAPRVGRGGLPPDAVTKAINVDCGAYFRDLDPNAAPQPPLGSWTHSWHIGNPVFTLDLALTMEGAIDRVALPTRRIENGKMVLQPGERPLYQQVIDIKADANVTKPKGDPERIA